LRPQKLVKTPLCPCDIFLCLKLTKLIENIVILRDDIEQTVSKEIPCPKLREGEDEETQTLFFLPPAISK